jgi:hypothetical protein
MHQSAPNAAFRGGMRFGFKLLVIQHGTCLNDLVVRPIIVFKYLHQNMLSHHRLLFCGYLVLPTMIQ